MKIVKLSQYKYLKVFHAKTARNSFFKVTHTKQQIADTLGLRVETVIRVIKNLEKKNELQIIKRKIFR